MHTMEPYTLWSLCHSHYGAIHTMEPMPCTHTMQCIHTHTMPCIHTMHSHSHYAMHSHYGAYALTLWSRSHYGAIHTMEPFTPWSHSHYGAIHTLEPMPCTHTTPCTHTMMMMTMTMTVMRMMMSIKNETRLCAVISARCLQKVHRVRGNIFHRFASNYRGAGPWLA